MIWLLCHQPTCIAKACLTWHSFRCKDVETLCIGRNEHRKTIWLDVLICYLLCMLCTTIFGRQINVFVWQHSWSISFETCKDQTKLLLLFESQKFPIYEVQVIIHMKHLEKTFKSSSKIEEASHTNTWAHGMSGLLNWVC